MSLASPESNPISRQWRLIVIVFAIVVAALVAGYVWFLRGDYTVLVQDVRPEEAAAIVEELKKQEVGFELKDGGTTILVPESDLNAARLNLSSKELPLKGTVGFELFNESDMGLTDFAQKVNYQRALQGEITRTLMAMDGIASARVHLALPERSLFRTARSEPRAAVTITPAANILVDADRVAGIQRLVAATVPDLAIERVAVLNERGQLLTPAYADITQASGSDLERGYAERVRSAIAEVRPHLQFDLKVATVARVGAPAAGAAGGTASPEQAVRDHGVRLILFTRGALQLSDEQAIRDAVAAALSLSAANGDQLEFSRTPEMAAPLPQPAQLRSAAVDPPPNPSAVMDQITRNWLIALTAMAALLIAVWQIKMRRARLSQRDQLVVRIREQLRIEHGRRR